MQVRPFAVYLDPVFGSVFQFNDLTRGRPEKAKGGGRGHPAATAARPNRDLAALNEQSSHKSAISAPSTRVTWET